MSIGVLALQGDFSLHQQALARLGVKSVAIRKPQQLTGLTGLAIPGGESTTLLNLMDSAGWFVALRDFHAQGGFLLGTCAGMILLASEVSPVQKSLGLIDISVQRNAFGRQLESFEGQGQWVAGAQQGKAESLVFIRAPAVTRVGVGVEVLIEHQGVPVLMRQNNVTVAAFHPEMGEGQAVYQSMDLLVSAISKT